MRVEGTIVSERARDGEMEMRSGGTIRAKRFGPATLLTTCFRAYTTEAEKCTRPKEKWKDEWKKRGVERGKEESEASRTRGTLRLAYMPFLKPVRRS